jgi:hypothetical protein
VDGFTRRPQAQMDEAERGWYRGRVPTETLRCVRVLRTGPRQEWVLQVMPVLPESPHGHGARRLRALPLQGHSRQLPVLPCCAGICVAAGGVDTVTLPMGKARSCSGGARLNETRTLAPDGPARACPARTLFCSAFASRSMTRPHDAQTWVRTDRLVGTRCRQRFPSANTPLPRYRPGWCTPGGRRQAAGGRRQAAGGRRQAAGGRW